MPDEISIKFSPMTEDIFCSDLSNFFSKISIHNFEKNAVFCKHKYTEHPLFISTWHTNIT